MPKAEAMAKRLGSLVDEFKELVYPPDYNPEGKAPKRKQGKELGVDIQRVGFFFFFSPPPACYFYFILCFIQWVVLKSCLCGPLTEDCCVL